MKHCSNISAKDDEILINETQAMWDLRHFAIPAVRDLIRLDDNSLILATSYIEGPTLEQVVQKIGAIPVEHVSWIVERILNALWYIHERGIVHGDLKPQNIILQHVNHHACLVDFGLSMIKPSSKDRCPGYTEYFSPPEQMDGLPLLPESDFYSLGVTIIYALVGGDFKHVTARDVPSNLPDPFAKFIKKLLVRDALQRPSWSRSNIFEEFQQVRAQSFGRGHTNMEPIKGL
jgi:serine/threonine-protein kinase